MRHSDHWTIATVRRTIDLTPTVREFELVPEGPAPAAWAPGSHLNVRVQIGPRQETRTYSLVGLSRGDGVLRIAVKRLDPGRGGSQYMWSLQPGARLSISEPGNHFALDLGAPGYLLVAGGIGVTPLVGMAELLGTRPAPVRMLYAARQRNELACLDRLEAALGERLATRVADEGQMIDFAAEFAALPAGTQVYLCGPVPMMDAARRAWAEAGRDIADLRYETFGSSGRHAPQAFTVKLPRHGVEVIVEAGRSLLDTLEAQGIAVLSDCRRGECGLCTMDVLACEGTIDHRDVFLSDHEKAEGKRLCACVSRIAGPGATVVLDTAWRDDSLAA